MCEWSCANQYHYTYSDNRSNRSSCNDASAQRFSLMIDNWYDIVCCIVNWRWCWCWVRWVVVSRCWKVVCYVIKYMVECLASMITSLYTWWLQLTKISREIRHHSGKHWTKEFISFIRVNHHCKSCDGKDNGLQHDDLSEFRRWGKSKKTIWEPPFST